MADPIILSWTIQDDRGLKRAHVQYINSDATLVQLQAYATAHLPTLEACVGGVVTQISVQIPLNIVGPGNLIPVPDCPTDEGAIAAFSATGTGYRTSLYLPTFRKTLITAGEIVVAGPVTTWYTSLLTGEGQVSVQDKAGRDLLAFLSSRKSNRK